MCLQSLYEVVLEHRLVESIAPGQARLGLLEWHRGAYEREAKAFASELLMPLARVRERWFADSPLPTQWRINKRVDDQRIRRLAREFGVTFSAMRVRLKELMLS